MKQFNKIAIITGISGQDGAYLSRLLINKNYKVYGFVRHENESNLNGLIYLNIKHLVEIEQCDLTDLSQVLKLIKKINPDEIYNLAAQSSVSLSFKQPTSTFHFNTISVFNLLEAITLHNKNIKFYQASTSEMYGKVTNLPISETTPFYPVSPYGISKASAHWICIHYRESYKMNIYCGILFNHESYLRRNTFFIKKIIHDSILISKRKKDLLSVGNIDVKRDIGFAPMYVEAMYLMMQSNEPTDYMICSGYSVSLREIINYIFDKLNISHNKCVVDEFLYRPAEIENIYGSPEKAFSKLKWRYNLKINELLDVLLEEELNNQN
jgi:GDPmannose 4,6-dehydratase